MVTHDLIIHIGFPKAGSTWLQEEVFTEQHGFFAPWTVGTADAVEAFTLCNQYTFDPEATYKRFQDGIREAAERHLIPVISHEDLTGNAFFGSHYDGYLTAERIHSTFPEAKIFIVIREQRSMILSGYQQYIREGGKLRLPQYLGTIPIRPGFRSPLRKDFFEYDQIISRYQSLFGRESVLVLPIELLREDPSAFCSKLAEFVGLESTPEWATGRRVNKGIGPFTAEARRVFNRIIDTTQDPYGSYYPFRLKIATNMSRLIERLTPSRVQTRWKNENWKLLESFVVDSYQQSNRIASQLVRLDLSKYGYL